MTNCHICGEPGWTDPRSEHFDDYGGPKQLFQVENADEDLIDAHEKCLTEAGWDYCCPECGWAPRDPDPEAVSAEERYEMAAEQKRRLR